MIDADGVHVLTYDEQGEQVSDEVLETHPEPEVGKYKDPLGRVLTDNTKGILFFRMELPIGEIWDVGEWTKVRETSWPWRRGWGRVFGFKIKGIWFPGPKPRVKVPVQDFENSWITLPEDLVNRPGDSDAS